MNDVFVTYFPLYLQHYLIWTLRVSWVDIIRLRGTCRETCSCRRPGPRAWKSCIEMPNRVCEHCTEVRDVYKSIPVDYQWPDSILHPVNTFWQSHLISAKLFRILHSVAVDAYRPLVQEDGCVMSEWCDLC